MRFDDLVNDLDTFSALKYTIKGPNSIGNKSSHNVNIRLRGVHPSFIGNLDINTYSSSSPGLSGSVVPFAKTKGLYFDDTPEPQNREFTIAEELGKQSEEEGNLVVWIGGHDAIKYYDARYKLMEDCSTFKVKKNYHDKYLHIETHNDDESVMI